MQTSIRGCCKLLHVMHKKERPCVLLSHRLLRCCSQTYGETASVELHWQTPPAPRSRDGSVFDVVGNLYKTDWLMHQVCELHLALVQFQCWV